MAHSHSRIAGLLLGLVLALSCLFGPASGVAHAEPGPRPTLTPVPPAAQPAAPAAEAEPAAPAPTPRPAIVVVLTPIAPVQAAEPQSAAQPGTSFGITPVRYQPGAEAAPAAGNVAPLQMTDLLSYRALLASLAAFAIVGICILMRRRVVRY